MESNCMLTIQKVLLGLGLMLFSSLATAQADTTALSVDLSEITISDSLPAVEAQGQTLEAALGGFTPLSELLSDRSTVFIKSYGLGSSATISLRGGSASHTQVLWEDIPVTNPMLGVTDLSLLPTQLFSAIRVDSRGSSSSIGSGAISGVISVAGARPSEAGWLSELQLGVGSFGARSVGLTVGKLSVKELDQQQEAFSWTMQPYYHRADNDFTYQLGNTARQQLHADYENRGVQVGMDKQLGRSQFSFNYWVQQTDRLLPPTSTQNFSTASQYDFFHRVRVGFRRVGKLGSFKSVVAYLNETNDYSDPERLEFGENNFEKYFHSSTLERAVWAGKFTVKYEGTHIEGQSLSYLENRNTYKQFALYGALEQIIGGLQVAAGLRREWNNIATPPLIPSLRLGNMHRVHHWYLQVSREYRVPTLNELYWTPGGNLELQPELGWNREGGYTYDDQQTRATVSVYDRSVDDWILWIPQDGSFRWSPTNVAEVTSRGWEVSLRHKRNLNKVQLYAEGSHAYVYSVHRSDVPAQSIVSGDQLIYTPRHRARANVGLICGGVALDWNTNYTSGVSGVNDNLDGYVLSDLRLSGKINLLQVLETQMVFTIENIFNQSYRVVERRPMPGRYFQVQWTFKI